jgi:hypothetical protein
MGDILDLDRERYIGTRHDYEYAVKRRNELMWTKPIMDQEITDIDLWLLHNPHATFADSIKALTRSIYCLWVFYGDMSPQRQHLTLLRLREGYREYQRFPKVWQEALAPIWNCWLMEFIGEEMEEASGAA